MKMKKTGIRLLIRECTLFIVLLFLWIVLPFVQLILTKLFNLEGRSYFTCTVLTLVTKVLSRNYLSYWVLTLAMAVFQVLPFIMLDLLISTTKARLIYNGYSKRYNFFDGISVLLIIIFLLLMLPFFSGFC